MPTWAFKALLALIAIGFPVAVILAWAFEITPEGVKLDTRPAESGPASKASHGQYVQLAITAILAVAVGYLVIDKFRTEAAPATAMERSNRGAALPETSPPWRTIVSSWTVCMITC